MCMFVYILPMVLAFAYIVTFVLLVLIETLMEPHAAKREGQSIHKWRNYGDLNEYFGLADCFRLGWPMRVDADFFCLPSENSFFDKSNVSIEY
ncbi:hypothetical protein ACSQ67_024471 [Phaseolus vulgaris]